jgi:hypothetical protein
MKNYSFQMSRRVAMVIAVIGMSVWAAAAAENVTLVVPFDFTVGTTDFQAGGYRVSLDVPSAGMVTIQSEKGSSSAIVLSRPMSGHVLDTPTVMFDVFGEKRFLSRILTPNGNGCSLSPNEAEIRIARGTDTSRIASVNMEPLPDLDR